MRVERDDYLIACGRYIELNPVRAQIVSTPGDYPWSSYKFYAYGKRDDLIDVDPLCQEIGKTDKERRLNHQESFNEEIRLNLNRRFLDFHSFTEMMEERF